MSFDKNVKGSTDKELSILADYILDHSINSDLAYETARYCLMDAMGCAMLALNFPECSKLLGPIIPDTIVKKGSRVPGTRYELDPILAAFNIGTLIRWLDFNDTWLALEWGHPSDNLGAILAVCDYQHHSQPITMRTVLTAMIKAYEIQGMLALNNSFNRIGLDHVILVKLASAGLASYLLGGSRQHIIDTLSQVWIDGHPLRTYRHAPNTGSRKSWAAGDATSRGVRLAWLTLKGETGYSTPLSAKKWGFNDVTLKETPLKLPKLLDSYVMENILFKVSFPAEFHAQTAAECALALHNDIKNRFNDIEKIIITTQESAIRIISKQGPLYNPADRDHCLQYIVAIGLLYGDIKAEHYEDTIASDPRIDELRHKMEVKEDLQFSKDYLDPAKRSISNAIQIFFKDKTNTEKIQIDYPIGHRRRRDEAIPLLFQKFRNNLAPIFSSEKIERLCALFENQTQLEKMSFNSWMNSW